MNENLSVRSKRERVCKNWILSVAILVATAALAWWLAVGMGLPYVAWCLATTVVGLVLYLVVVDHPGQLLLEDGQSHPAS